MCLESKSVIRHGTNRAADRRSRAAFDGLLFTGWRGEIVGDSPRAAMAGELAVYRDPKRGVLAFRS